MRRQVTSARARTCEPRTRWYPLAAVLTLLAALALLATASVPAGAVTGGPATSLQTAGPAQRTSTAGRADALREQARAAQHAHLFTRATALYERARGLYLDAAAMGRARACLAAVQDLYLITSSYACTRAEMRDLLASTYPAASAAQIEEWLELPSTEAMRWDGEKHYFYDVPVNLAYRDVTLFQTQTRMLDAYQTIYEELAPYETKAAAQPAWQPYAEPRAYDFTQTLAVPRAQLPASGDLRIWFPLPIETGPQGAVRISEVAPTTWLRYPASTSRDIGLLFMRVPLTQLTGDLDVTFRVQYQRAAEYFKVDPERVGRYDTSGALYRHYTASRGNTKVTPSIRRTARRIVGAETNPYLAGKRLYDYVIGHVLYSHMPHMALWPRGAAESVYVHEHKYGDCGAQSMYFSALCRSVGIPARCTGGFQTFMGAPAGHFWAELYLPNYGWIPVDPTAATIADYLPALSAQEKQAFHDFYFGDLDDLRLVVQKDTDLPLIPRADGRILLPMAVQMPAALCATMEDIPGLVLMGHWTFE